MDNYDGLVYPRERVQNICGSLKLIIQDNDSICKILHTTFQSFAHVWYNNLKSNFIERFINLCVKLATRFNTNIHTKKSSTKLFGVIQKKSGESTQVYLKRFDENILKVEELLESIALKTLIRGVREHVIQRKLYALPDISLLKVKHVM